MLDAKVPIPVKAADELIARLIAVRGQLNDYAGDHPVVYEGVPAALDFVDRICKVFRRYLLGEGSGPLQNLLVKEVNERLHATDIQRHFTRENFESQIKRWNGYQTHLVSPELAIRGIIGDAFADVLPIADWIMESVRLFMSEAAKAACKEVALDDPQKREALAMTIEALMEEVFDAWMEEARSMSKVVMDMEKQYVTPVYWRRLMHMRQKHAGILETLGGAGEAPRAQNIRGKVGGFFSKFGRRGAAAQPQQAPAPPGTLRLKAPKQQQPAEDTVEVEDEEDDDYEEDSEMPTKVVIDDHTRLAALRGLVKVPDWAVSRKAITHANGDKTIFLVGRLKKRSHKTRTFGSTWADRWFAYNEGLGELYYWHKAPDPDTVEAPTAVMPLHDATIVDATLDEMSGLEKAVERQQTLGLRIEMVPSAKVKAKHQELIIAFESLREKETFRRILKEAPSAMASLTKQLSQRGERGDSARKKRQSKEKAAPEEEEDEDAEEGAEKDDGEQPDSGDLEDAGSYNDGPVEAPDTPTAGYQKGGLGMGSKYFAADDIRDPDGHLPMLAGRVCPPSSARVAADAAVVHNSVSAPETVEWLAGDASMYVTIVNDSISAALPKVAVMSLVERAVNRELLACLQEKLLAMPQQSLITLAGEGTMVASPATATSAALEDIETAMVEVRAAAHQAAAGLAPRPKEESEDSCEVSVLALALGNFTRRLKAANQEDPESLLSARYGPLFPLQTLEAADAAARRRELSLIAYDRTVVERIPDPLAIPGWGAGGAERELSAEPTDALRKESRGIGDHFRSMVEMSRGVVGLGGRKRVTDADVREEHRQMASAAPPSAQMPAFRGHGAAAAAAAPAAPASASRAPRAAPAAAAAAADPLAPSTAPRERVAAPYDPLAPTPPAPQPTSAPATSRNTPMAQSDDDDELDLPDVPAPPTTRLSGSASNPNLQAVPLAPPARAVPPAPVRRAPPPAPVIGARRAPPAPAIGAASRPAPLAPMRPAPLPNAAPTRPGAVAAPGAPRIGQPAPAAPRGAPMRPSDGNLPL